MHLSGGDARREMVRPTEAPKLSGEDVADFLAHIFQEIEQEQEQELLQMPSKPEPEISENVFAGRFVNVVSSFAPFEVTSYFLTPQVDRNLSPRILTQRMVEELCGCRQLGNVLLVITPSGPEDMRPYSYRVNCYRLDNNNKRHLSTTTLTHEERELIEQHHARDNYAIVYCSRYIQLVDAARNTPIRAMIFASVCEKSLAVRRTRYQWNPVSIVYRNPSPLRVGFSPERNNYGIRSLQEPKIPVRMLRFSVTSMHRLQYPGMRSQTSRVLRERICRRDRQIPENQEPVSGRSRWSEPERMLCSFPFPLERSSVQMFQDRKSVRFTDLLERPPMVTRGVQRAENSDDVVEVVEHPEHPDGNGVQVLWEPMEICESVGHIPLPSMTPGDSTRDSLIRTSSITITRHAGPAVGPPNCSPMASQHLKRRLRSLNVKMAFLKFGQLVKQINTDPIPQTEHLLTFFQFVETMDFKIFVRRECSFPGDGESGERRYRLICYVFEDRQDFVATIGLQCRQLHQFAKLFPVVARNLRFVDNAFELTAVPPKWSRWLRSALDVIHVRRQYDRRGELTPERVQPKANLLALTRNGDVEEGDSKRDLLN